MFSHKLRLQYHGREYFGWQKQKGSGPTVQGKLEKALRMIFKEDIKTMGSGRTDTGVHAYDQYAFFSMPFSIPAEAVVKGLNSNLPQSIRVIDCTENEGNLHPTVSAKSREYRYLFTNTEVHNPLVSEIMANNSYKLDFSKMEEVCSVFIGKHDFVNYFCVGSDVATTVREIFECELVLIPKSSNGLISEHWMFRVVGTGFLKQMVRLMVGTMWAVGREKFTVEEVRNSLKGPSGSKLGAVVPASGLHKFHVDY